VAHTFLMQAGRWSLQGSWIERNQMPTIVKGGILVAWSRDDWYTMVTKLVFPESELGEIAFQYRGRLDPGEQQYTFVLHHSLLGKVEGEGWIAPDSVIQRYWVLGDERYRRSGFETLYRVHDNKYFLSSGIMSGHYLTSIMEATIERQFE
jgi:hypothetical protein